MLDETPVRWERAIQVAEGVYRIPPAEKKRCDGVRSLGFEEGKRAVIDALLREQALEWDRRLIKTT